MTNQKKIVPQKKGEFQYSIKGASKLPDAVKQELIPLRGPIRSDIVKSIVQAISLIRRGAGNREQVLQQLQDSVNILKLGNVNERVQNNNSGRKASIGRIMGSPPER